MYGLGIALPISILSNNPTLKEWFADQGRPLEAVGSVEATIDKDGLHIWVCFAGEPDIIAYHVFAIER